MLFTKTGALLADLAGGRADGSHAQRLRRYLGPSLLILDDFAMREYTLPQTEDLYDVISRRYRRGALILTTNREPKDLDASPYDGIPIHAVALAGKRLLSYRLSRAILAFEARYASSGRRSASEKRGNWLVLASARGRRGA